MITRIAKPIFSKRSCVSNLGKDHLNKSWSHRPASPAALSNGDVAIKPNIEVIGRRYKDRRAEGAGAVEG